MLVQELVQVLVQELVPVLVEVQIWVEEVLRHQLGRVQLHNEYLDDSGSSAQEYSISMIYRLLSMSNRV